LDGDVPVEGIRIPAHGKPEIIDDLLMTGVRFRRGRKDGEIVRTRSVEQARLAKMISEMGEGGRSHFLPIDKQVVENQIKRIDALMRARSEKVRELIESRTSDAEIGRRASDLVMARF
jgi:hypothetical protein